MHFYYQWAVMIGGGLNHRMGLFDAIMIKDNHIASAGSVAKALESAQTYLSAALEFKDIPILCEARTLQEVCRTIHNYFMSPRVDRALVRSLYNIRSLFPRWKKS